MGIENSDGTQGLAVPGRNASYWLAINDFVEFVPGSSVSIQTTVNPKPLVTVTNPAAVCSPATINLNAAVSSNVTGSSFAFFTDAGANNPVANPGAVSATGTYYVRATSGAGCASDIKLIAVTINPLPTPSITGLASAYCKDAPTVTLTGSPSGGSFTIDANAATQFNPATLSVASHTVVYAYTDGNGCSASTNQSVAVNALPNALMLSATSRTLYATDTPLPLTGFVTPAGNPLSFSGVNGLLNPPNADISQAGIKSFSVSQINTNGCASPATPFSLTILPISPANQTVCRSSSVVLIAGAFGTKYEWYKNGQSAPFKLTEIASIQKGTTASSLTLVSVQTTATYYVKVFQANGSSVFNGPFAVTVNYACTAPGARQAAAEVAEIPLTVTLTPNPVVNGQLRAVVRGAESQPLSVELIDLRGQVLQQQQWPVAGAEQAVEWNVSSQAAGLYLLRAQTPTQRTLLKVVHQ